MSDLGVSISFNLRDRLTGGMRSIQAAVGRVGDAFKTTARSAEALEKELATVGKRVQNAAFLSLAAGRLEQNASRMRASVRENIDAIRPLEAAIGGLKSLDIENIDVIKRAGIDMQRQFAGMTSAAVVGAAYDIKSGISTLSDEGVADMTRAAVMTAKATKAQAAQMTSLFATGYGIFKRMDSELDDAQWGAKFSAGISSAVKLFKTTGEEMQMAIERSGSGLTLLGSPLEEQLTLLGMLKTSMRGEIAGTSVKTLAAQASTAQQAFDKMGYSISLIDAEGKLMPIAGFLRDLQAELGDTYNANIGDILKDAFGTQEAVTVIQNMWGMADAFEANQKAIGKATKQGLGYTNTMAKLMDANFDSLLKIHAQRWDLVRQAKGDALKPLLTALLPVTEIFARMAEAVMRVPILGPTVGVIVLGIVGLVSTLGALGSTMAGLSGTFAIISRAQYMMHLRNITLIGGFKALGSMMAGGLLKGLRFATVGLWQMAAAGWAAIAPFWPIIAIVAAVAGAAFLIIKFWAPISAFFVSLWGGIKAGAVKVWEAIKYVFGFSPLGMIIKNWDPIVKYLRGLWDKIGGIIEKMSAPFRNVGSMFRGATAGAMAGAMVAAAPMAGSTVAAAQMSGAAVSAAPVPATAGGGITPIERTIAEARTNNMSSTISAPITIHAAPGQNPEQIAAAVARELDARGRQAKASERAGLYDV